MSWVLVSSVGDRKGHHWEIAAGPLVLGRSVLCAVVIEDPSVSRQHCKLYLEGGRVHIQDLGSLHPPLVNGNVKKSGVLAAGDTLNVGGHAFIISRGELTRDTPPQAAPHDDTVDLFAGAAGLACENGTAILHEGRPQSVSELIGLFDLARCLSRATDRAALSSQVLAYLAEAQGLPDAVIALVSDHGHQVYWDPDGARRNPALGAALDSVRRRKEGLIRPVPRGTSGGGHDYVMAAPLIAGGVCYGALLAQTAPDRPPFDERDLNRLLSLAQVVAPYYKTVAHVARLEDAVAQLDDRAGEQGPLVGKSKALRKVRGLIRDVAPTGLNILITGETGTGKEIAARMLHQGSPRAKGPFIAINCAAIPDHLFESEMFGHEKGAFTGADKKRKGRFALADEGTLFLDEIGELSPENQARLLRVLETGCFHPVGAEQEAHADVRLIAATNRDLKRALRDGRFRRDLYHRIGSVEIPLPALRQRPSDIPLLAQHFAYELTRDKNGDAPSLTDDALAYLQALPWTGNVRELRNAIERATALAKAPQITPRDLTFLNALQQPDPTTADHPEGANGTPQLQTLAELERQHITHVLEQCNYNVSKAAKILGVHRNTLHNKIAAYGIGG